MTAETPRSPVAQNTNTTATAEHASLKYSLLGPSLTKAGQESVDQSVVCTLTLGGDEAELTIHAPFMQVSEVIYNASKGSKFFNREEERDKSLTAKIEQILAKKSGLGALDLSKELRAADRLIAQLESSRDLTQYIVHVDCDAFC